MSQTVPCQFIGGPLDGLGTGGAAGVVGFAQDFGLDGYKFRASGSLVWHLYTPIWNVQGGHRVYRYVGVVEEAKK